MKWPHAARAKPDKVDTTGMANIGAVKRGDNLYDVVYIGDSLAKPDYIRDMTLYQSAQLCQQQGYKFFKASDAPAYSNHAAPQQPVDAEAPKLTLSVSCLSEAKDGVIAYGVDSVIARVKTSYATSQ